MNALPYDPAELALTLFADAADALFLFRADSGQIVAANPMAERWTGLTRAQLVNTQIAERFRPENPGAGPPLRDLLRSAEEPSTGADLLLHGAEEGAWIP